MSGLEVNKILASIFVALIVVGLISILGEAIVNEENNQQVENAYFIDISEIEANDLVTNTQNEDLYPTNLLKTSYHVRNCVFWFWTVPAEGRRVLAERVG